MDTVQIPRTDLTVPPFAVGAMWWGTRVPVPAAHGVLDHALEVGATFVDTANNYAFWEGGTGDESETAIGDWITARGAAARDRLVLASKVGARPGAEPGQRVGLGRAAVLEQVEGSLRRLRTDRIDLLYAHLDDHATPLEETVGALQEVVDRGWARAIAGSNLTEPRLREALDAAGDGPRYVALQNRFTFLPPEPGTDLGVQILLDGPEPLCAAEDVLEVGYSTLLEGAYSRADKPLPRAYDRPGSAEALRVLREVADRARIDASQAVLAWLAHRERRVVPVVGASRPEQLDSAITATSTALPADEVRALEEARASVG
jgi:aryl-alcohol dehydrogenase-like predicted oxidoreductase